MKRCRVHTDADKRKNYAQKLNSSIPPVCSLLGVGETEDGAEFHSQDEVKDEEGLVAQRAGHIIFLETEKQRDLNLCHFLILIYSHVFCTATLTSEIFSHRQTLGEIEAVLFLGRGVVSVGLTVDGAEKSGLVEAQLLQLLRVLRERGGKEQLLHRHLRRRETGEGEKQDDTRLLGSSSDQPLQSSLTLKRDLIL